MRGQAGQALIEIALAIPLVGLSLIGAIDTARVMAIDLAVQSAARVAAMDAASAATPTPSQATTLAAAELAGPGIDPSRALVTLSVDDGNGGPCANPPTVTQPCFASVRVRYTFTTLVSWPGLPSAVLLDSTRTFRRYR